MIRRARSDQRAQDSDQRRPILDPRRIGCEARIGGQLRPLEQRRERRELPVIAGGDHERAVAGLEDLIGHDRRMAVAVAARLRARHQSRAADIGEHRQLAIVERHVDMLAAPVAVAGDQGGEDRLRRRHAGEQIGDRDPGPHRLAVDRRR